MTINSEEFNPQTLDNHIIAKAIEDAAYKQRLLNNPKAVVEEELGSDLPEDVTVQVLQQSAKHLYLLLPIDIDELVREGLITQQELEAVAGGRLRITLPGRVKGKSEFFQSVTGNIATVASLVSTLYSAIRSRKG
ncbi:hypothetical protein A4S05_02670 [Nostoc sp. KVJ20]|uniref:NHLP leader peptide family RiPP precursor n=1 Tax=Nostoc sp. KVJ20 TaxID=457944 RepID=UPI00083D7C32|nr:NHLP leader peptide family RiPP precursor [Nostoc sp. KVJ20]ODH02064.1 hypothetical protein A4S05_02670 [Nostoc sp. KVJ20]